MAEGDITKEVNVAVRSYFATPVAVMDTPDSAARNAALREIILAREQSSEGVAHSNLGGWQSSWDFQDWGGAAGREVVDGAVRVADKLTADRSGKPVEIEWRINSWANINRTGHANEFHTHPGSFWSATYYVDDGGIGTDAELGGGFEIQDPRGVAPAMYAPLLGFAIPGGRSAGASELIQPKAGMMVVFPSWLSHGVRPYTGTATRISIAINLSL